MRLLAQKCTRGAQFDEGPIDGARGSHVGASAPRRAGGGPRQLPPTQHALELAENTSDKED
eukprot:1425863-Lingulodinium_polyedra.AAC.1